MKNVIVSTRIHLDKHKSFSFSYDEDVLEMLQKLNLLIQPIKISRKIDYNSIKNSDGLFLMGGGDIYKNKKTYLNNIRDNLEKKLYRYFYNNNKPIVGICRGFQNIMNFHGINSTKLKGHVRTFHNLKIEKNKFINYRNLKVNSYHNYCIKNLPKNFLAISKLKDGSIEIAKHKNKKILCLMFHPERKMISHSKIINSLKKYFR